MSRFAALADPPCWRVWDTEGPGWVRLKDDPVLDFLLQEAHWFSEEDLHADGIDGADEGRYQIYPVRKSDLLGRKDGP